jgi:hypothetical protein
MNKSVATCVLLALSSPALSDDLVLSNFDRNGNGVIDEGEEARIYFLHKNNEVYRKLDTNYDGKIDAKEVAAFEKKAAVKTEVVQHLYKDAVRAGHAIKAEKVLPPDPPKDGIERHAGIILRQSFDDVSIFSNPFDASDAQGASLDWSRDRTANTLKWSARGVLTVPITWERTKPVVGKPYVQATTFAPYFQFERESASQDGVNNKDIQNLMFGVMSETAYANFLRATHYVRFKTALLTDFSGTTKAWLGSANWMPVSNWANIGTPITLSPIDTTVTISPTYRAEYASNIGGSDLPIFAEHNQSLRIGPSVQFDFKPINPSFLLPDWLMNVRYTANFSWLKDTRTHTHYNLSEYSLTYNLNKEGTIGLQTSYRRGKIVETGENINLIKVGLSVKDPLPQFQLTPTEK